MIDIVKFKLDEETRLRGEKLGFSNVIDSKDIKVKIGSTDLQNRKHLSDANNDVLMNPELENDRDKVHFRKSGLNQVLAKLAKENDVGIGFGFSFILNLNGVERARMIGRMRQNVRICRKFGTKMIVCSYAENIKEMREAKDLLAFAKVIGMTPGEAKEALNWKRRLEKVRVV